MAKNWGFCGPTYTAQSPNWDAEEAINLYCENSESPNAKTPISMVSTPGLKVFAQVPEPSIPTLYTINGRTFFANSQLWELTAGGTPTSRGNLNGYAITPPQIVANQFQLLILSNGNLYVFTLATNTLVAVNMAQFNGPVSLIAFADGYFFAVIHNSNTFQVSNIEDGTTWNGLNISTISYFPDNIVSLFVFNRQPWFWSNKRALVYYNAGAGFPPFIPIQDSLIESGSCAQYGPAKVGTNLCWLEQTDDGALVARMAGGYGGSPQRISTHATEFAWQQYPIVSDAVSYTYQDSGHLFWVVRFPSAPNGGATWVFDVTTGYWHKRAFWNSVNGQYSAHRSTSHTYNFSQHLVGDWASGTIYTMSSQFLTDFGNPLRWLRRTPAVSNQKNYVYFKQLVIDVEAGLGPQPPLVDGDGQPRGPQMLLRWSNDGSKTWSNQYILSAGEAGKYGKRVVRRMLGRARERVFEVSGTDPIPWRFADAYLEAEPAVA